MKELTEKYPDCKNCGANDYEIIGDYIKCEFCGSEYENPNFETKEYHNETGRVVYVMPPVYGGTCAGHYSGTIYQEKF